MIRNLCVAAIRLLALYLGIFSGLHLITILSFSLSPPSSPSIEDQLFNPSLLSTCVTFALAVALWVYAARIAERMAADSEPEGAVSVDAQDFVLIGLCLLGAATLIDSIPSILNILVAEAIRTAPLTDNHHSTITVTADWSDLSSPNLLESIFQTVIGFGLLLFGFRLKSVLRKFQTLRTKGHDKD